MKYIITISLLIISIVGCQTKNEQNLGRVSDILNPDELRKQEFIDYFFRIYCPCELEKASLNSLTNFKCIDTSNFIKTIYKIDIIDYSEDLKKNSGYVNHDFFRNLFIELAEKKSTEEGTVPSFTEIQGSKAIIVKKNFDDLIKKTASFTAVNFNYTLSVISLPKIVDSLFTNFTESFESFYRSKKYPYSVEIPKHFSPAVITGVNVDFHFKDGKGGSIVIVVKAMPDEYSKYSIWDIVGDLETFGADWEEGAKEHMVNPKFLKIGKTEINGIEALWHDHTTDLPHSYLKNYALKKNNVIFFFTLASDYNNHIEYSKVWLRFKNNIRIY